ncbi:MAG TPA: D-aminoacylase [Vicinamibacterales bacterium]|nr:D-aminoacylase [Vicinamibacterales bacterium]
MMPSANTFSTVIPVTALLLSTACGSGASRQRLDIVIAGGTVYDGSGGPGVRADVGILGDEISAVGDLGGAIAATTVRADGLAVAPGFVNMMSSDDSLRVDGRSMSDIKQGVTTEIFGEGDSMGPLTEEMRARRLGAQGDLKYPIAWSTLHEGMVDLEKRGVSANFASFIGAATLREYAVGLEDKRPTADQLETMRNLVDREMREGALGIASALIYAPGFYATTEELIEISKVAAQHKGIYISHMRSEGNRLVEAVDELIRISREAGLPAEIYHLKAAGQPNWSKMDRVIEMVEAARKSGLRITADMYTYTAGGTGLDAAMPPWAEDGGYDALFKRLRDPAQRKKIAEAIRTPSDEWENLSLAAGSPDRILLVEFKSDALKPLTGKTLAEAARIRGKSPEDTIMDLVLEDQSRIGTIYFMMSDDNLKKEIQRPWVSFASDASSIAAEGVFLKSSAHPRAYGSFARVLGKYVRDEHVLTLPDAIRKLAAQPSANLGLGRRGLLEPGMFADVVVFDPATIADRATFEKPHAYAVGVRDVFVNGVQVLKDGEHTGKTPGRALWGAGNQFRMSNVESQIDTRQSPGR